jgi:tetratricopeptide (TPR) repeat protein
VKHWILAAAGAGLLLAPALARASDESDVLRSRAVRLIRKGDCDAALPLLERARAADPREARAGLLAGRCLIAKHRYAEAESALLEAADRDPRLADVQLQLAVARYHREDLAGARSALEVARRRSAGSARFELYDALVLLGENRRPEALAAFERARAADAASVDPVASYFEGMTAGREGQPRRAYSALERVTAQDPGGPWGTQAQRQLDQMGTGLQADGWVTATLGFEWDSNVVLQGEGVRLPEEFDHEEDVRLVWSANTGVEALRTLNWSGGAMLSYSGSAHDDVDQFDYHYPVGSLWIDRHLSERTTAHLQYDAGYAFVDSDSWLTSHNLAPALLHDWGNGQRSRLFGRAFIWEFRFDRHDEAGETPEQVAYRDRDGHGTTVGVEHLVPVEAIATDVQGGIAGTRYSARGSEYSHRALESWLGGRTRLPWELSLVTRAGFIYRPYNHSTSFRDPGEAALEHKKRRDHVKYVEVGLERPLGARTSAAVRWHFIDSASNVDVFDYDRSIVGAYLSVRFD